MPVAFVADLESCRHAATRHRAKYVQAFDQNREIDLDAYTFLFDRVLLKQVKMNESDALSTLGVLAADLESIF